jgi:hypothetical protein
MEPTLAIARHEASNRDESLARLPGDTTHAPWDLRAAGRGRRQARRLARNRQAGATGRLNYVASLNYVPSRAV